MKLNFQKDNFSYEIKPPNGLIRLNLKEIWQYKDLLYILIWRNVKARYKQTAIGVSWVIFQPLVSMLIFTVFFGKLAKVPSDNVPYPVFVYTGLIFWNYFATALAGASNSLVEGQGIIKKIYFPRLIMPLASTITPLVDFILVFIILFGLMAFYHYAPGIFGILLMPVLILITFSFATGLGLILASLNVKYRDVGQAMPFFVQVLFFVTPVIYPVSIIPEKFQWLIYLNPMAGVATLARASLLRANSLDWRILIAAFAISMVFLIIGILYFRKTEHFFADEL